MVDPLSYFSFQSVTGVTKVVICVILAANQKE